MIGTKHTERKLVNIIPNGALMGSIMVNKIRRWYDWN